MSQVRTNPLPPGRYWIGVISPPGESRLDAFRGWAAANPKRVTIEKTEPLGGGTSNGAFFIFRVTALPIWFFSEQFGFPNEAGPEIQSAADTLQRPPEPTPAGELGDIFGSMLRALDAFDPRAKVLLAVGVVYLLARSDKR